MKNNIWSVGISKTDSKVYLARRPAVRDFLYTVLDEACDKTNHILCGTHEVTHRIPLSLKKDEWDGVKFWSNTLGMALFDWYNDAVIWLTSKDEQVMELPLTKEELEKVSPDLAELLED